jgi:hypothetical protein
MQLRKIVRKRGYFPTDEAANQFAILYDERFINSLYQDFLTGLRTQNF